MTKGCELKLCRMRPQTALANVGFRFRPVVGNAAAQIMFLPRKHGLRFTGYWSEVRRWFSMPSRGLESRSDPEQHCFVKRARDEVDANRQVSLNGAYQLRSALSVTHPIPDLRSEPIGARPFMFGSRGAVSFRGGTVDMGETSASSRCSCMHCSKRF